MMPKEKEALVKENLCAVKYPIMLVHGIGYCDTDHSRYWGRIPQFLQEHGAKVYFGNQPAFGKVVENAYRLKQSVQKALEDSGADKLNLIAHSRGGIEARYLISQLGMEENIASLTTLATPHRGIATMDAVKEKRNFLYKGLIRVFNRMLVADGKQKNKALDIYEQFTEDYMTVFNQLVLDAEDVFYQSYAFDMKNVKSDPAMGIFHKIIKKHEGVNDGLVPAESCKWGEFQGVVSLPGKYGISHPRAADSHPMKPAKESFCIAELYGEIAENLKKRGF